MDVRQLSALVAIADHGTFSAAARALFTVQSNVSGHIAKLEKELGVVLVDRALVGQPALGGGQHPHLRQPQPSVARRRGGE